MRALAPNALALRSALSLPCGAQMAFPKHRGTFPTMRIFTILCLLTASLFTGACKQGETAVDRATREGILIMGNTSEPKGLDPHIVSGVLESNIIRALFEGLVIPRTDKRIA